MSATFCHKLKSDCFKATFPSLADMVRLDTAILHNRKDTLYVLMDRNACRIAILQYCLSICWNLTSIIRCSTSKFCCRMAACCALWQRTVAVWQCVIAALRDAVSFSLYSLSANSKTMFLNCNLIDMNRHSASMLSNTMAILCHPVPILSNAVSVLCCPVSMNFYNVSLINKYNY